MGEHYQIWEETDPDGCGGITLATEEGCRLQAARNLLGSKPVLVLEFEADSWEEACRKRNDHYGWEPYKPMDEGG